MITSRPQISLDGTWEFAADNENVGLVERWYEGEATFTQSIHVPGCWQAQDVYCHTAWYRRSVVVPEGWRGQCVWLKFDGVSYVADVWVNGQHVIHHEGLMLPFRQDISRWVRCGESNTIVVRAAQYDYGNVFQTEQLGDQIVGVYGCWITWGGIFQSVSLESSSPTWIDHVFLIPDIDREQVTARVRVRNSTPELRSLQLLLNVNPGDFWESTRVDVAAGSETTVDVPVSMRGITLWHPDQPFLYTANVTLAQDGAVIDALSSRFGMRSVEARGQQILLNHEPIFLRGWLDDAIYPDSISPTITLDDARAILQACKDYGFNFVRHHTHIPVTAFHEAADEIGVLQLEEFGSFGSIGNPRIDPTQKTRRQIFNTWRGMIERDGNHPSIIAYGVNNECWNEHEFLAWAPVYRDLYRIGKALDPTRLIIDNSGGEDHWSAASDVYDKHIYQFPTEQEMQRTSQDRPYRAYIPKREAYFNVDLSQVGKPCLVTEVGGWCTFPDFDKIRARTGGKTPWWLSRDPIRNPRMAHALINRMETGMAAVGLGDLYPQIVANSERWAGMANKLQIEHMRQTPGIAGYAYCTFTDCYNWGAGILDNYFQPKSYANAFAQINQASILLWPRDRWCFSAGQEIEVALAVSYYDRQPVIDGCLRWRLVDGDTVLADGALDRLAIQPYGVYDFVPFRLKLPEIPQAARLTLHVELEGGQVPVSNEWPLWVFPSRGLEANGQAVVCSGDDLLRWQTIFPFIQPAAENPAEASVWITAQLDEAVIAFLEAGGRVLWLENGSELNCRPYHQHPAVDYHATIINPHPVTDVFPHEGWCDMQFHHLTGTAALDTGYFEPDKLTPIIEAFHVPYWMQNPRILPFRRKGFLAEVNVERGRLLCTTFVFDGLGAYPEVGAMAHALIDHLLAPIQDAAYTLSANELREWVWGSVHGAAETDFVPFLM